MLRIFRRKKAQDSRVAFPQAHKNDKRFNVKMAIQWRGEILTTVTIEVNGNDRESVKRDVMKNVGFAISGMDEVKMVRIK